MLSVKNKLLAFLAAFAALAAMAAGIFFKGKTKGRQEAETSVLHRDLQLAAQEMRKAEEVRKAFNAREESLANDIKKNAEEKRETVNEAQKTDIFDLNKWVIFLIAFLSVSCGAKETVIYRTAVPYLPYQYVFERPVYDGGVISFGDNSTICFDKKQFMELFIFIGDMKEVIKNYEAQAEAANNYNKALKKIYGEAGMESDN